MNLKLQNYEVQETGWAFAEGIAGPQLMMSCTVKSYGLEI